MTKIQQLQSLARRHLWHVISLTILSVGSGSFAVALQLGLGGFEVPAFLVAIGLIIALFGATMHHFGETLLNNRMVYLGTSLEGLAWYIWSINGAWLINLNGSHLVLYCLLPGLIFLPLPSIAYFVNTKVVADALAARIIHRHAEFETPVSVLLIEPSRTFGKALTVLLLAKGHKVDCFVGVSSLTPLKCIDKDGHEVEIDASKYQIALVDHQIDGSESNLVQEQLDLAKIGIVTYSAVLGPQVVEILVGSGLPCVGISTNLDWNTDLKDAGAKLVARKDFFYYALATNNVHLNELVAIEDVSGIERDLGEIYKYMGKDGRRPASDLMNLIGKGEKEKEREKAA
jgi:hypothetical protein